MTLDEPMLVNGPFTILVSEQVGFEGLAKADGSGTASFRDTPLAKALPPDRGPVGSPRGEKGIGWHPHDAASVFWALTAPGWCELGLCASPQHPRGGVGQQQPPPREQLQREQRTPPPLAPGPQPALWAGNT